MTFSGSQVLLLALAATLPGCLGVDERPPAGALVVQMTSVGLGAADEAPGTILTEDGWTLALEHSLLTVGEVRLMGNDACEPYSENQYLRVLDLLHPGPQRVALSYARGRCEIGFLIRTPAADAVLGAGVDEAAREFLRLPGTDPFVTDEGVTLQVEGTAQKDAVSIHFAWSFRQGFDYTCPVVSFDADTTQTVALEARVARLFVPSSDDAEATARFDAVALADTNGDGEVILEELAAAPPVEGGGSFASLGEQLYFGTVPDVVNVPAEGGCEAHRFGEEGSGPIHANRP